MQETRRVDYLKLIVSIAICQAAGIVGAFFTSPAIPTWYQSLAKPPFTPPNWLFAPVWTILFLLMGVALYIVWFEGSGKPIRTALLLFAVQLALNVLWSAAFFGLRSPLAGLIDIVLLWLAIVLTTGEFFRKSLVAGLLLVPYLLWVSFAAFLNYSVWQLNP